jgi:hypothetical protein
MFLTLSLPISNNPAKTQFVSTARVPNPDERFWRVDALNWVMIIFFCCIGRIALYISPCVSIFFRDVGLLN